MYSPEEVLEEDLQYTSELRRCTAYNMKAKNRLRICTFTHTRKLKLGMYVCTMQLCTVHFEHYTHTDELGLASAGMSLSIFLLSAAMMIQPWPRRSVILRNEFCCHKKTKKEEEEARDLWSHRNISKGVVDRPLIKLNSRPCENPLVDFALLHF